MSNKAAATVAKNSIWLIVQPLLLSIISLFVVGFVARTLGPNDYGIFVFAFAFTTMFKPVINMGLRALTVRTIAEQKVGADEYLGQMLMLRFFLGIVAIGLVFVGLVVFKYSELTIAITLIASTTLLLQSLTSVFHDSFQAHETMRHVAVSQFVSGIMTSACTILVMLLGYGLYELVAVYVLGNLITLLMSIYYQWKHFKLPPLNINLGVFGQCLKKGFPFFVPMILNVINGRFGLLLLSKFGTNSTVATYGAATNLTDKLLVVPEGLGASIFPTMASLAQNSKDQAVALFQRYSRYILLLGLPMAVGTTALADEIVDLIYGPEYKDTAIVVAILIWGTFFGFLNSMNGWTLNAMHREKIGALIPVFTTPIFLVVCFSLAKSYGVIGVAVAICANAFLTSILLFVLIRMYVTKHVYPRFFLIRAIIAVGLMYFAIKYAGIAGVFIAFAAAVLVYVICLPLLGLIDKTEMAALQTIIKHRLGSSNHESN